MLSYGVLHDISVYAFLSHPPWLKSLYITGIITAVVEKRTTFYGSKKGNQP